MTISHLFEATKTSRSDVSRDNDKSERLVVPTFLRIMIRAKLVDPRIKLQRLRRIRPRLHLYFWVCRKNAVRKEYVKSSVHKYLQQDNSGTFTRS